MKKYSVLRQPPQERRHYVCSQVVGGVACEKPAIARYTWPGRDETGICADHLAKLQVVAEAMGLPLQIIDLEEP
jgi:hypothetical protein